MNNNPGAQDRGNTTQFSHAQPARNGVLLLNLGTPDEPTAAAVRRYLAQFLSDRRVVDAPRWIWRIILHGVILRVRPGPVARKYASVWHSEGSPLLVHSQRLTQRIADLLCPPDTSGASGPVVELAMTYGNPSIDDALAKMREKNVRQLLVVPMFPQYSSSTTAAAFDGIAAALADQRWIPELRFINTYHNQPEYIAALADSVRRHQAEHGIPEKLLMSFHGIPQRYFMTGDPYHCLCQATARLLAQALDLKPDQWELAFQSRFGRETWLQPYLDQRLGELATEGTTDVQVICPGFAADCLETLEEIAMENRELFEESGGKKFSYISALNDDASHAEALQALIQHHVAGWSGWDKAEETAELLNERVNRAQALGAPG
ncbi:MAG: ferrochelatase [Lysobacterales bacterium]